MTILDAANALLAAGVTAASADAATMASYLQPANIVASAAAASLPLPTLTYARDQIFGGVGGLTDHDNDFTRRALIAAKWLTGN